MKVRQDSLIVNLSRARGESENVDKLFDALDINDPKKEECDVTVIVLFKKWSE